MKEKQLNAEIMKPVKICFIVGIVIILIISVVMLLSPPTLEVYTISSKLAPFSVTLYNGSVESVRNAKLQNIKEVEDTEFCIRVDDNHEVKVFAYLSNLKVWYEFDDMIDMGNNQYTIKPISLTTADGEPRVVTYRVEVSGDSEKTLVKYFSYRGEKD